MKNLKEIKIGKTKIGGKNPVFIVAEIGINFDGKFEQALKLIDSAADAKCNAVKFQLFKAERMYVGNAGNYITATGQKKDILEIVKKGELPPEWVSRLKKYAYEKKLEFFSTVCDEIGADLLKTNNMQAYKFASYEITHIPLFKYVAKFKKPIIFSSGGAKLNEIVETIEAIKSEKNNQIILMHCVGQYPAQLDKINLKVITTLQLAFPDIIIGYSDHTSDPTVAPRAAVLLGAKVIEKHITLNRKLPGPDHSFALDPNELKKMVKTIRQTEKDIHNGKIIKVEKYLLGTSERKIFPNEIFVRNFCYRSIFAIKDIRRGEKFSKKNLAVLRPGKNKRGLEPKYFSVIINGFKATKYIKKNDPIDWN